MSRAAQASASLAPAKPMPVRSPFAVPAGGWWAVLKRTWAEAGDDNISLIAAGTAFYAFAAIVPLLGAIVLSYGLFATPETVAANVKALFGVLPADAAKLIGDQLAGVVKSSADAKGWGLALALVLAIYGATKGASSVVTALNIAYEERETRNVVVLTLLSIAMVVSAVLLALAAVAATAMLALLEGLMPGAPGGVLTAIRVAGYVATAAIAALAAAALYRFGPNRRQPHFVWLSPGSLAATLLWLLGTLAFGVYVKNFANYGATYGSLSAVIVLLTWIWLSAYVFLLGAELNSELERQVGAAGMAPAAGATPPLAQPALPAATPPLATMVVGAGVAGFVLGKVRWRWLAGLTLAGAAIARAGRQQK